MFSLPATSQPLPWSKLPLPLTHYSKSLLSSPLLLVLHPNIPSFMQQQKWSFSNTNRIVLPPRLNPYDGESLQLEWNTKSHHDLQDPALPSTPFYTFLLPFYTPMGLAFFQPKLIPNSKHFCSPSAWNALSPDLCILAFSYIQISTDIVQSQKETPSLATQLTSA